LRIEDVPGEVATPTNEERTRRFREADLIEAERMAMEEVQAMPRAVQVQLQAGDYFVYRNLAWHTGNYLPYQPRATIHDIVQFTGERPAVSSWYQAKKNALEKYAKRTL
jgi:hypothetical protein